jgi:alkylation response protein AidB-like acyl-CoA dehydrogenase
MNFESFISFGLTEASGGSNASSPLTNARKVPGGFILNGHKRWIGQGTSADFIVVWASNVDEDNKVQGFVVQKGSPGLKTEKMIGKMACRMTQNADIHLKDVFVSDKNRLSHATDF